MHPLQFTLPGTLLSALGWIGFLVGFGWLNEQTIQFEINGSHAGRGFLAEYYLLAISPPIYFILFSIYMLTGLWAVGILVSCMPCHWLRLTFTLIMYT